MRYILLFVCRSCLKNLYLYLNLSFVNEKPRCSCTIADNSLPLHKTKNEMQNMNSKTAVRTKILFICLGNICRSPAAHAVFQKKIDDRGLSERFEVDSAGIGNWHVGQLPDRRMREHGARRDYQVNHHARQFQTSDFKHFDRIVVMDEDNYRIITSKASSDEEVGKVVRMADFFTSHPRATSVPDPYYGSAEDFELALDLIEDGVEGMLKEMGEE